MIKSNFNQMANAANPWQGPPRRVLCVCSAGLLRSPTLAHVLQETYGYNTRACGSMEDFALIPISTALLNWAQEVVFVEQSHYDYVTMFDEAKGLLSDKKVVILNVPDAYEYMHPELKKIILEQYEHETSSHP